MTILPRSTCFTFFLMGLQWSVQPLDLWTHLSTWNAFFSPPHPSKFHLLFSFSSSLLYTSYLSTFVKPVPSLQAPFLESFCTHTTNVCSIV